MSSRMARHCSRVRSVSATPRPVQHLEAGKHGMLLRFVPGDRRQHVPFDQTVNPVFLLTDRLPPEFRRRPEFRHAR